MTPVYLSLLLPGLGQLYQRRFFESAVCFVIFIVSLTVLRSGYVTIWFVAVASAIEAWRARRDSPPEDRIRLHAYRIVAVAAGVLWMGWSLGHFVGSSDQLHMNNQMQELGEAVRDCIKRGTDVRVLADCKDISAEQGRDRWGNTVQVDRTADAFYLRSAGRDGQFGTSDDLVYAFK